MKNPHDFKLYQLVNIGNPVSVSVSVFASCVFKSEADCIPRLLGIAHTRQSPSHAHVKASIHVRKTISYTDVETCLIGAMYPAREAETLSELAHRFRSDIRSLMVCAVYVCVRARVSVRVRVRACCFC